MQFDLTPSLAVKPEYRGWYLSLRIFLYLVFFVTAGFIVVKFIFPDENFFFDFRIYFGAKNTIAAPRTADSKAIDKATVIPTAPMFFNTSAAGDFSVAQVSFNTSAAMDNTTLGTLSVTRAYRAILYPEGAKLGFRNGTPLTDGNTYFLVSQNHLRPFASLEQAQTLGFNPNNFIHATNEELQTFPPDPDGLSPIKDNEAIEDWLIKIGENYYALQKDSLIPFVSIRAYLSQHRPEDAVEKDDSFATRFPIDNDHSIGFADGTLISYGDSVYAIEGPVLRPIDSVDTFLLKGYQWDSVIPATGEEFGMYTRGRLYTIREPHPNGTVFRMRGDNQVYMIDQGMKRPVVGEHIRAQYLSVVPVVSDSIPPAQSCTLKQSWWYTRYTCDIPLTTFDPLSTGEYQFMFTPTEATHLTTINIDFTRYKNKANYETFLQSLALKFHTRYTPTP